jgi:hypothetical protein
MEAEFGDGSISKVGDLGKLSNFYFWKIFMLLYEFLDKRMK